MGRRIRVSRGLAILHRHVVYQLDMVAIPSCFARVREAAVGVLVLVMEHDDEDAAEPGWIPFQIRGERADAIGVDGDFPCRGVRRSWGAICVTPLNRITRWGRQTDSGKKVDGRLQLVLACRYLRQHENQTTGKQRFPGNRGEEFDSEL